MISPGVARLVERNVAAHRIVTQASTHPPAHCPLHPECLLYEEAPTKYRCAYGHSVPAADINREVTS